MSPLDGLSHKGLYQKLDLEIPESVTPTPYSPSQTPGPSLLSKPRAALDKERQCVESAMFSACVAIHWAISQSKSALKGRFIINDGEYKSSYANSLPKNFFFFEKRVMSWCG